MKLFILIITLGIFSILFADDSLNLFPADTGASLKMRERDITPSLNQMNDTAGFGTKKGPAGFIGKRPRDSIFKFVLKNISTLQYEYIKRLAELSKGKRGKRIITGKIKIRFSILNDGTVLDCGIQETSVRDSLLELRLLSRIYKWNFGKINEENDTTTIEYPFVFSK
jgi:hypothetical protein